MVQNVLNIVYREIRGLHEAVYILALFTFGSQLLALVRDRLLAHQFGASIELDLYYTAFRIPDVLYVVFASMLSIYVLIPFLSKRIDNGSHDDARQFLSQFFSIFVFGYTLMAAVAMVCAPTIVQYVFPGFAGSSDVLVPLMQILLLQPLLLGVSNLFGIITQIEKRFMLYALSPIIYNIGIIFGLVFLYPYFGVNGLVLGVVLGAFGHVCIQIPSVLKSPLAPRITLIWNWREIVSVCKVSCTRALTLSLHQFVLFGFVSFASIMTVGSVSVFQFAYNLQSVPLAIIGVSYSVVAFPLLAQLYSEKKYELFGSNIMTTLRHILFWSLPVIALFIVVRAQFVRVVLGSGEFDWSDTRLTAAVLALFILSLTAQAVHLLIVRALYAVENTRIPFFVTLFSSVLALVLAYGFYIVLKTHTFFYNFIASSMRLEDVSGIEVLALPLGYSCALIIHSIALILIAQKRLYIRGISILQPLSESAFSALVAGTAAYFTLNYVAQFITADTLLTVFMQGMVASVVGLAAYVCTQYFFKSPELSEVYRALHRKFKKDDIVVPQDEDTLAV